MRETLLMQALDVSVSVEPLDARRAGTPSAKNRLRDCCHRTVGRPLLFTLALASFLLLSLYMLGVSLLQGIGMLGMYLTFPTFMRLVYPTGLGSLHTMALGIYRRFFLGAEGHSRCRT